MKRINNITLGTDPEFFLIDKTTGKYIPIVGLIGGTKHKPLKLGKEGHAWQEDNVMAEVCIPPTRTAEGMWNELQVILNHLRENVIPKGTDLVVHASAFFSKEELDNEQALTMGCDPDFNAWTMEVNEAGDPYQLLRTAGGHVHVGYEDSDMELNIRIIKAMDLFLGVGSILLDSDTERRKMYGKAGCFRPKKYGVEYRTLSNFWTASQELVKWMFDSTMKAIEFVEENKYMDENTTAMIQNCINSQDKDIAKQLILEFKMNEFTSMYDKYLVAKEVKETVQV